MLIDFGTSIPASTRKIGADLAAKGVGMIDAATGSYASPCQRWSIEHHGGRRSETFEKMKPLLEQQGENVFYVGSTRRRPHNQIDQ